jgi:O-antigen/teichoic acid export membrane protein
MTRQAFFDGAVAVKEEPVRHKASVLLRRLSRSPFFLNLASVTGATIIGKMISLVALGYPARKLGPMSFGLVGYAVSVSAYARILLSPGLMMWGTREIARDRAQAGKTLLIVNLTQLFLACFAYCGLALFAFRTAEPAQRMVFFLSGLVLFQTALNADWAFNGLEVMRIPAAFGVLTSALSVAALFTLVHSPSDVSRYAAVAPLSGIFVISLTYCYLYGKMRLPWMWPSAQALRVALWSSLPLGGAIALVTVLHHANSLIVKAYLGTASLGVFLSAYNLLDLAGQVPSLLGTVFLPRLARVVAEDAGYGAREARVFAQVHMTLAFFIAAFMLAEAPAIIRILYGPRYVGAVSLLRLMAIAVIFNYAICGYTNCLISFGRDRVILAVVIVCTVASVGGGLLLVPRLGTLGAAIAVTGVDLSGWLVSLPYYRRTVGSLQFSTWWRPLLGGLSIVGASLFLHSLGLPIWERAPVAAACFLPFVISDVRRLLL